MAPPLPPLTPQAELALLARTLFREGYDDHLAGHITYKQADDTLLVNPWGLTWDEITASDVMRIDKEGEVLEGKWTVTPAIPLHVELHRARPDVGVAVAQPPAVGNDLRRPATRPEDLRPDLGDGARRRRRLQRVRRRGEHHRERQGVRRRARRRPHGAAGQPRRVRRRHATSRRRTTAPWSSSGAAARRGTSKRCRAASRCATKCSSASPRTSTTCRSPVCGKRWRAASCGMTQASSINQELFLPEPEPREVFATIISVDDHLVEPADMFEGRLPAALAGPRAAHRHQQVRPRGVGVRPPDLQPGRHERRRRPSTRNGQGRAVPLRPDAQGLLGRRRPRPRHGHQRRVGLAQLPVDDHRLLRTGVLAVFAIPNSASP